jgi:hypothetical protein
MHVVAAAGVAVVVVVAAVADFAEGVAVSEVSAAGFAVAASAADFVAGMAADFAAGFAATATGDTEDMDMEDTRTTDMGMGAGSQGLTGSLFTSAIEAAPQIRENALFGRCSP